MPHETLAKTMTDRTDRTDRLCRLLQQIFLAFVDIPARQISVQCDTVVEFDGPAICVAHSLLLSLFVARLLRSYFGVVDERLFDQASMPILKEQVLLL